MVNKKKILFVCVGNTCRSQMAEGFARAYGGNGVEVKSAGTSAAGFIHKGAVEAMREKGIDISGQSSTQLTKSLIRWADVVVTTGCMCAEELCGEAFGGEKRDWPVEDPLGRPFEVMRSVRDDIERRVRELLNSLRG
jgi:protein-tyrosine-phosphatase